ncbi:MAG: LysR family transcriptional regulator [Gammaproteobacteria bacterium]|nr:LysR family transcriptional regulator [Gammaproteobacteria bacterium]
MPIDSIRDLRLFARIYEERSITAAAEALALTPAVASKRLKVLEAQVGEALFHRSTRRLSPTGAGTTLYTFAREIIAAAEQAGALLRGGDRPVGLLRVTSSPAFGRLYLADIVAAFLARHDKVEIETIFTDRFVDMVDEAIDVAIRISAPVESATLIMKRLTSGRRILCASRAYVETHGAPAVPGDLLRHNCIVLNHYDAWTLGKDGGSEAIRVRGNYRCDDVDAVLQTLRSDLGIGVVALWHGAADLAAGRLCRILPDYELSGQPGIYAVYHPSQRYVPRVRCFVEFVEEHLSLPFRDADEFLTGLR